jgi:hypothetical protein
MISRPPGLSCLNRSGGANVAAQVTMMVSNPPLTSGQP